MRSEDSCMALPARASSFVLSLCLAPLSSLSALSSDFSSPSESFPASESLLSPASSPSPDSPLSPVSSPSPDSPLSPAPSPSPDSPLSPAPSPSPDSPFSPASSPFSELPFPSASSPFSESPFPSASSLPSESPFPPAFSPLSGFSSISVSPSPVLSFGFSSSSSCSESSELSSPLSIFSSPKRTTASSVSGRYRLSISVPTETVCSLVSSSNGAKEVIT